jgi:lipid-A-disaccharide synthase-like uncharacterized protein
MPLPLAITEGFGWDVDVWTVLGLTGNAVFGSRFFVQWLASERRGDSVIPTAFWWLSIVGSIILVVYFFHRGEIVGIVGNLPNSFIYARNLHLIQKRKRLDSPPIPAAPPVAPEGPPGGTAAP